MARTPPKGTSRRICNRVDASSVVRAADPTQSVGAEAVKLRKHSDPLVAGSNPAGGATTHVNSVCNHGRTHSDTYSASATSPLS
jgi:hypothetical protein